LEITAELIAAGKSERGGLSRKQMTLLGVEWPPRSGWRQLIIGRPISDDDADEFIRLAGRHHEEKAEKKARPVNWCGSLDPIDIYLYVLALADGCFYVGLTSDVDRRLSEHLAGEGAEWTKLHPPQQVLHSVCTGTKDGRAAEQMEDEVTVTLMLRHGIDKVRGGHFSYPDQESVEIHLRQRGQWERIKQAHLGREAFNNEASWAEALDGFLKVALSYYDAGAPAAQHDAVFAACYRLTRYRYWHDDFAPGLSWHFWNRKGVLPVLLSFKLGRPVGNRLASPYEVLAAALTRGRKGKHPLRRLFLLAWQVYMPETTTNQAATVTRFMEYLNNGTDFDRQYDAFVSVLLPETRYLLRQK